MTGAGHQKGVETSEAGSRVLAVNFKSRESRTKLRGGYYTPRELARWLVAWALGGKRRGARVLEPGCGDGAFLGPLVEAGARVTAIELDPVEAAKARSLVRGVVEGDALSWLESNPGEWDAAVGNPPYIRYQYLDDGPREVAARLCAQSGVTITKLANAWVPFVVASLARLVAGGRLAMVVPAEIMHVHHAAGLRRLLEHSSRTLALVHLRDLVFEGALQGVVLLLVEKAAPGEAPCAPSIVEVETVADLPAKLDVPKRELRRSGRWMWSLLTDDEARVLTRACERFPSFGELASVDVGIVTGANDFFVVDRETVERFDLEPWVLPMVGRSEQMRGLRYRPKDHEANERAGRRVAFLSLSAGTKLSAGLARYLEEGEKQDLPARYKCRIREPWWAVPYVWRAPVVLCKRCHAWPRLVLNEARVYSTDTVYRVKPRVPARDLVGSFTNTVTLLSAELEGRHYGGGVLELVPSEIERVLVPLAKTSARELAALDALVRRGELPLERQDARLLVGVLSKDEILLLRGAWERLRDRRLRKGAPVGG